MDRRPAALACSLLLLLALAVLLAPGPARAEDGGPAWSPPSNVPAPSSSPSSAASPSPGLPPSPSLLPPPRVVVVVGSPPAGAASLPAPVPSPSLPGPAAPGALRYYPELEFRPSGPAAVPAAPGASPIPLLPGLAAVPPAALPGLLEAALREDAVLHVEKRHGAPWWGNWKALELDMLFAAVGEQGKEVGASVTFHDETSGEGLRSRLQPYADADGAVSVWTSLQRVDAERKFLRATLKVPYRAFPFPTRRASYPVEARVRLLRREADGTVTLLARQATTFTVEVDRDCPRPVTEEELCARSTPLWQQSMAEDIRGMFGGPIPYGAAYNARPVSTRVDQKMWFEK